MDLRTIAAVVTIADAGSASAAAELLHLSQPALSRRITALEDELGHALFQRTPQGLRLNAAGRRFLPIARDLTRRSEVARRLMSEFGQRRDSLSVVCPVTFAHHMLTPFIATGGAGIADVVVAEPEHVLEHLERHAVDVAINLRRPPAEWNSTALFSFPITAQFPTTHELAGRETVELSELVRYGLIVPRVGSNVRAALDDLLDTCNLTPRIIQEARTSHLAQAFAAAHNAVAIALERPSLNLQSAPLTVDGEPRRLTEWAAWSRDHYADAEIRAMLDRFVEWAHRSSLGPPHLTSRARPIP